MTELFRHDLPRLPARAADSHKGDYGRVLLIGGAQGMAGAIALAGIAALRSGAGLVRLAVPEVSRAVVAGFEPSYMTLGLPCDAAGRIDATSLPALREACDWATVVACGPGLGRSPGLDELVKTLFAEAPVPAVFDADALHGLATPGSDLSRHVGPRVLTPHPGELRRLLGANEAVSRDELIERAHALAAKLRATIVVKGSGTAITDGTRRATNATGNPGMATGGTGDVLTGIVAALLAQGLDAFDAARLAAHAHGLAGDLAARELGETSLIASDLPRYLASAFRAAGAGHSI